MVPNCQNSGIIILSKNETMSRNTKTNVCPFNIIFFLPTLSTISVLIKVASTCIRDKRTIKICVYS